MDIIKKSDEKDYRTICEIIAKDIEYLKDKYPQLEKFTVSTNLEKETCLIEYEYKCHFPINRVGWTGGVPNPNPDGIWFYIGLWDENNPEENSSQINTQPVFPKWYLKNKRVTYLMLEGEKTDNLYQVIFNILKNHGLKEPNLQE
jgi:hypothetical protein